MDLPKKKYAAMPTQSGSRYILDLEHLHLLIEIPIRAGTHRSGPAPCQAFGSPIFSTCQVNWNLEAQVSGHAPIMLKRAPGD